MADTNDQEEKYGVKLFQFELKVNRQTNWVIGNAKERFNYGFPVILNVKFTTHFHVS